MSVFSSSTQHIPAITAMPQHVAIIMDGNGRWAKQHFMPRVAGHKRGLETVRAIIKACIARDIKYLTLFAFSSENWRRPAEEVSFLMGLFMSALENEVQKMHSNGIRLKIIGDLSRFESKFVDMIRKGEMLTAGNTRLTVTIAANYGGRWDILQAVSRMIAAHPEKNSQALGAAAYSEADLAPYLSMSYAPEPDLFIRTGGEERISNFLLWQLAYSEFHFTTTLWPEFDAEALDEAIASYQKRERRFGRTSEQLQNARAADSSLNDPQAKLPPDAQA